MNLKLKLSPPLISALRVSPPLIFFKSELFSKIVLLIIQGMQIMTEPEKTAKILVDLQKKHNKPIVCSFVGGKSFKKAINIIEKNKIPNFKDPKRAASIIKYLTHE